MMNTEIDSKITDSEWEVMRVVWAQDKVTSKQIIEVLQQKKDWKPATTKTFIGRLVKKGMLHTETEGKKYIYSANINESEFIKSTLDEYFDKICSKDVGNTIVGLISKATLSFNDIEKMEKALEMKKKNAVEEVACNCIPGQCKCKDHSCSSGH
ncbi:CopY/TcrY family copper transport repressor [Virgibacillus halodenitrificans]|uniref:CopY/TcrY family copper transport repressor n=1 Tax=Virgibacillus halodenitrificans TaxID=1482 RepID=A0ABR7VRS6_VIRHA|nr:CopY/TcrY family copper transport repressor [Virgibacillus halodenitrificans]MBD1223623.1 CopY/TcrY family copper transport repressor [Virgibacillus halodenitrificans]MYL56663.1 CopY/TcrY family copper transport repressor [Virgibacillus halodenitrificans]